ncbi:hypothetical protein GOP47_0010429 [Adiantum capillus-veneris]|uniref:GEX2 N-terminal Ig-like domain-containing protein n=1 Tax=Adiantum capillus-veneris TaxID=13818 RepID=A0A9D4ZGB0_ADICA|nr:hypothetical protein GOP47_0010429 [Adiantum capillus-veneris]
MRSCCFISYASALSAVVLWSFLHQRYGEGIDNPWDVSTQCSMVVWTNVPSGGVYHFGQKPYYMVGVDYVAMIQLYYKGCESSSCRDVKLLCNWERCPACRFYSGPPSTLGLDVRFKDKARGQFNKSWIQYSYLYTFPSKPDLGVFNGYVKFLGGIKPSVAQNDAIILQVTAGNIVISDNVTLHVQAGPVNATRCSGEWISKQYLQSHTTAQFRVLLRDVYGNVVSDKTAYERDYSKLLVARIISKADNPAAFYQTSISMSCGKGMGFSCTEPCQGWLKLEWNPVETVTDQWLWVAVAGSPPMPITGSPFFYTLAPVYSTYVGVTLFGILQSRIYIFKINIVEATQNVPVDANISFFQSSDYGSVQSLHFALKKGGNYLLHVGNGSESIKGSPFKFQMLPGRNEMLTGLNASLVQPGKSFTVPVSLDPKVILVPDEESGIITIQFRPKVAGNISLQVTVNGTKNVGNSPLLFVVKSGPLDLKSCSFKFKDNTLYFQAGTKAEMDVMFVDKYYNAANERFLFSTAFLSSPGVYMTPLTVQQSTGQYPEYVRLSFHPTIVGVFIVEISYRQKNITNSPLGYIVFAAPVSTQNCKAQWMNKSRTIEAGQNTTLRVWFIDAFGNSVSRRTLYFGDPPTLNVSIASVENPSSSVLRNFTVSSILNMTKGNQDFILYTEVAGRYLVNVHDDTATIAGSPLSLDFISGKVMTNRCVASWVDDKRNFHAGDIVSVRVQLKDAYGNNINPLLSTFNLSFISVLDVDTHKDLKEAVKVKDTSDFKLFTFMVRATGDYHLNIGTSKANISNSPLLFTVAPGLFNITTSSGGWLQGSNVFDVGGMASFALQPKDLLFNFVVLRNDDLERQNISLIVVRKGKSSAVKLDDLYLNPPLSGATEQIIMFSLKVPGNFFFVFKKYGSSLSGSPFLFQFTAGVVDRNKSEISGKGILQSVAGNISTFDIQLRDGKGFPSGSEDYYPQVSIINLARNLAVNTNISYDEENVGLYHVNYTTIIAGNYSITCSWRGVTLGIFYKTVLPGPIYVPNTIVSGPGLEGGMAGSWLNFTIYVFDFYNNGNPDGGGDIRLQLAPKFNFTYTFVRVKGVYYVSYNTSKSQPDPYILGLFMKYNQEEISVPQSPFKVLITQGLLSVAKCTGAWEDGSNNFEVGNTAKFIITQRDAYGNLVSMNTNSSSTLFRVQIYKNGQSLPLSIDSLKIIPIGSLTSMQQRVTFQISQPGEYMLQVGDSEVNIMGSPFIFSYFTGFPSIQKSLVVGDGLRNSIAGDNSSFVIQCRDKYGNAVDWFSSLIMVSMNSDSATVNTLISSIPRYPGLFNVSYQATVSESYVIDVSFLVANSSGEKHAFKKYVSPGPIFFAKCKALGSGLRGGVAGTSISFDIIASDQYGNANPSSLVTFYVTFSPNFTLSTLITNNGTGIFHVSYVIQVARIYKMEVFAQSDVMQEAIRGSPYSITIQPGAINMYQSRVTGVGLTPLATKNVLNNVVVLFKDTFGNLRKANLPSLNMIIYTNFSAEVTNFTYNGINGYVAAYMPKSAGFYSIVVSYRKINFVGVPYNVSIQSGEVQIFSCLPMGSGLTKSLVGSTQQILIRTMDMFGNLAEAKDGRDINFVIVISRNLVFDYFETQKSSEFSYEGSYTMFEAGNYRLAITSKGVHVHGSPFSLSIAEGVWSTPSITVSDSLAIALERNPLSLGRGAGDDYLNASSSNTAENMSTMYDVYYLQDVKSTKNLPIYVRAINDPPLIVAPNYVDAHVNMISNISIKIENVVVADIDEFGRQAFGEVLQCSLTVGTDNGLVVMSIGGDVAVTASTNNGTCWQPVSQLISANASLELIGSSIKLRASLSNCNSALSSLEYRSISPLSPTMNEIAHITIIVNDMGNYGCFNDCSTTTSVPMLAVSTIVIVNYGWFAHTWLLLRPGVLIGAATGIGMLLIAGASIFVWLHLGSKLLTAPVKAYKVVQTHSTMDALKARWSLFLSKFSKRRDFGPKEGQQVVHLLSSNSGGLLQFENPPVKYGISTENDVKHPGDEVQADIIHQAFAKEESLGDGVAENPIVQDYFEVVNAASSAFDRSREDTIHDVVPVTLSNDVRSALFPISCLDNDSIQSEYALDSCAYVQGTNLENESAFVMNNTPYAIDSPHFDSSNQRAHEFSHSEDGTMGTTYASDPNSYSQITRHVEHDGLASHSRMPICSLNASSSLQWAEQGVAEDDRLARDARPALDFPDSSHHVNTIDVRECSYSSSYIMPTGFYPHSGSFFQENITPTGAFPVGLEPPHQQSMLLDFANKVENTSITDQDGGAFHEMPLQLGHQVVQERRKTSNYQLSVGIPTVQEHRETSEGFSSANNNHITIPPTEVTHLYQHNQLENAGSNESNDDTLGAFENKVDIPLAADGAAKNSPTEYTNPPENESRVFDDPMPFGDSSSSSSHSYPSLEGRDDDRAASPHSEGLDRIPDDESSLHADERNTDNSFGNLEISADAMQMPELKIVVELSEAFDTDQVMDPLDHVDLVFSSLERGADGSLVAVLSQRMS